jgi:hypothetical protein
MSALKVHLDDEELAAVERMAAMLNVKAEDVAYAAINRLMLQAYDPAVHDDIVETRAWRRDNLPLWSDSAHSVHAYEGKHDAEPEPSRWRG